MLAKIIMIFFSLVACIQVIKPLGWPGLKTRKDAWKLAMAGVISSVAVVALTIGLRAAG